MASGLPPDQASLFLSLVTLRGRSFSPSDVIEAVRQTSDFPSALKFLSHSCNICQEQVPFNKMVALTHCSCSLCVSCFTAFFSAAILEKGVDQLVCPQCGRPEVTGHSAMDYFNLLDTQIRTFLTPQIHELFQRKLRDRALREMENFHWCSHCSFGMLHESERLRMDCPSCKKSTCCRCGAQWSPEHQGLSCQQFRIWQQKNQNQDQDQDQDQDPSTLLSHTRIECPRCRCVFGLSRGGCLHFSCSQCRHQFCGGCRQTFSPGPACGFSADCAAKGFHAHHPRDCLYHLRDWTVDRLTLLLQYHRVPVSWLEPTRSSSPETGVCGVLVLKDGLSVESACGVVCYRGGLCVSHYTEFLVDVIRRCHADPAVLYSAEETGAELRRWNVAVPTRRTGESEQAYAQRLRLILTSSVPLL